MRLEVVDDFFDGDDDLLRGQRRLFLDPADPPSWTLPRASDCWA
jgi:hypothetical protein